MCDSCRQIFALEGALSEQDAEQVDGLVTLSGLCSDCSKALEKVEMVSPSSC